MRQFKANSINHLLASNTSAPNLGRVPPLPYLPVTHDVASGVQSLADVAWSDSDLCAVITAMQGRPFRFGHHGWSN